MHNINDNIQVRAMSYAIESRKRKFDRILESLTDSAPKIPQPSEDRPSLNSRNNAVLSKFGSLEAIKRRRITPTLKKSTSNTSLLTNYLPSSRTAFLERLETFRNVTKWHIPSTISVNAAEWAKKGWYCADVDTVTCGSCSERVTVDLTIELQHHADREAPGDQTNALDAEKEDDDMAVEVYNALVERYHKMITTAHSESCSWRKRGCDSSIQRIEGLLNSTTAIAAAQSRSKSIIENVAQLPIVSNLPDYSGLPAPDLESLQQLDESYRNLDATKLAICGWHYKEGDVVECKSCFRSLGLWLYHGPDPTVEHLDPVDSHLEYCPWRSPEAQDTEYVLPSEPHMQAKKVKLPGWALVYHAMKKRALKSRGDSNPSTLPFAQTNGTRSQEHLSPEQRERKMKDLLQRIKTIKKPFNVKSLLRKKDKPDT